MTVTFDFPESEEKTHGRSEFRWLSSVMQTGLPYSPLWVSCASEPNCPSLSLFTQLGHSWAMEPGLGQTISG